MLHRSIYVTLHNRPKEVLLLQRIEELLRPFRADTPKTQLQSYARQAQELGQLMTDAVRDLPQGVIRADKATKGRREWRVFSLMGLMAASSQIIGAMIAGALSCADGAKHEGS
jgi:hypothetical protein